MGGLVGHMMHLYENPSLTFREIKDIFKKINDGKMLVTEKLDGQNLLLSFSVTQGKAKAARNHQHIVDGGISSENYSSLTEVKEVQNSFSEALQVFENAVKKFSIEEQMEIFGPNANYYYNCEVQDPRNPNVLNYDRPSITIHRSGHLKQDKFNKTVFKEILGNEFLKLEALLKENTSLNEETNDGFIVRSNSIRKISPLTDKSCYQNSLKSLQNAMNECGVSDKDNVAKYILNRLDELLEQKIKLPENAKQQLLKRLLRAKDVTAKDVYKSLNESGKPELIESVRAILSSEKKLIKQAISPIEEIVTQFGAGVLKEFQSSYIKDSENEIKRLRTKLTEIFDIVNNSGNPEARDFLKNQFGKIKNINNINSSCEGIVFKYDNDVYKMTGLFSPLNQILGMTKYARGKIAPIKTITSVNENKTAIVSFGRFNPPTIGHEVVFKMGSDLAKQNNADFFIIPTKTIDKEKNPLTIQEKISYLSKIFPEYNSNILNNTNINTIFDTAKYLSEQGYKNLKVIVGSDRKERFEMLNQYNKDYNFKSIEIVSAGERLDEGEGVESVSASKARQAAIDGDVESFMKNFAGRLELEEGIRLMNLIRSRIEIFEDNKKKVLEPLSPSLLNEYIRKSGSKWCVFSKKKTKDGKRKKLGCYSSRNGAKKRLRQVEYFKSIKESKELEEMTTASSGAVSGAPSNKNNPWLQRRQIELEEIEEVDETASNPYYPDTLEKRFGISSKRDDEPAKKEFIKILIMQEEQFMINRKEFIQEIKLRKSVREALKLRIKARQQMILQEEQQLRNIIRTLLQEKDTEPPHKITGINILKNILKKIVPTIEKDYKNLTTNKKQRVSFRAHILNATKNIFTLSDTPDEHMESPEEQLEEQEEQDPNYPEDPKFIPVRPPKKVVPASEQEVDSFSIEGMDTTGRDMAKKDFRKIEKQITDAYEGLSDEKDKEAFRDYLLTNLKLHMDVFEKELSTELPEPSTPEYEKEKEKLDSTEMEPGAQQQPPEGDETPEADVGQQPALSPEEQPPEATEAPPPAV